MIDFARVVLELRGVPRFKAMGYLIEAGGRETEPYSVSGDRWSAYLEALEPDEIGAALIARDRLVIEGERREVERVQAYVRIRTKRGG